MARNPGKLVIRTVTAEEAHSMGGVRTIAAWKRFLEQSGGGISGFNDIHVPVSLDSWSGYPDTTLLQIYVEYVDPKLIGTKDPDGKAP